MLRNGSFSRVFSLQNHMAKQREFLKTEALRKEEQKNELNKKIETAVDKQKTLQEEKENLEATVLEEKKNLKSLHPTQK